MKAFSPLTAPVAFLNRSNIDTDQIIPKQFLKRVEKTGYGKFLFYDWRYLDGTKENPHFELNLPVYKKAQILVTGSNFGCGSSREHAVWALLDYGFRVIIAPSFADIFRNNCIKNGLLPIVLKEEEMAKLFQHEGSFFELTVHLPEQKIKGENFEASFTIDSFSKTMLLEGIDEIGLTLKKEKEIESYEKNRAVPGQKL